MGSALRFAGMANGQNGKRGHVLTLDTTALNDSAFAPPTQSEPPHILTDTRRLGQPNGPSQRRQIVHFALVDSL